jgi:glycosyltransferase involved in cell wall biosynthesis
VTIDRPLQVCYFGTYRDNYSRNQMMIAGLRMNGVIVKECHETLWHGTEDRVRIASGNWMHVSFWWRIINVYWRLLKKYSKIGNYDVLMVGYPGQLDVLLARFLSLLKQKPLAWDIFMSIYLISIERGLDKKSGISIKILRLIEGMALRLPNQLILDTKEYARWFQQNYGIPSERFHLIPTGADDRIFYPRFDGTKNDEKFCVLYSGTFIPNHGVMYIVEAASLLMDEQQILFELIGTGPELENVKQFVTEHQLNNVIFHEWMEKDELINHICQADICLGAFGTTPQSLMTVQNKIYEAMAMQKPVISGDSPAVRQVFTHGEHIYLCQRASGNSIANAVIDLINNPTLRSQIAQNGYKLYKEHYSLISNGLRFKSYLRELT